MTSSTRTAAFGTRLAAALDDRGPLCVGIDPHPSLLLAWGLPDDVSGLDRFVRIVAAALADRVAVLKPQPAFFERHGARGIAVLEHAVAACRAAGALVLLDVKRADVGSTMQGYADAYLDPASPLGCDAITVTPYLGFGSVVPALDTAAAHGAGVFVVAMTSNPEAAQLQRATCPDGRTVAQTVLDEVAARNVGMAPMGSVGVVVGATLSSQPYDLAAINGPLLAPGVGAQGGRPADLRRIFGAAAANVVPSVSRAVLAAGPEPTALRDVAARLRDDCRDALGRTS